MSTNDLEILEHLGRGKKAKQSHLILPSHNAEKYQHYQKSLPKGKLPEPSIKEMLRTASRTRTQAIFKISSFGKGLKKIAAHMRYISRCGKLELEDQDGNKFKSVKSQKEFLKDWSLDFNRNERSRDTMHLVLSTPPGTQRQDALSAAKEFLEKEYKASGHDYVFVAHNDTDHPHIHAVIKMVSHLGKKLNPRKCYLRQVRKDYAEICQSYGINVEATSRAERGLSGPSPRSEFVQMRRTNRHPTVDKVLIDKVIGERQQRTIKRHPAEYKMLKRNQIIRKRYAEKAKLLGQKAEIITDKIKQEKYKNAAKVLDNYAKIMPVEISRGERLHQKLDTELGAPLSRQAIMDIEDPKDQAFDQYKAVTEGIEDKNGVYLSPRHIVQQKMIDLLCKDMTIAQKKEQQRDNDLELELELEIDIDD